MRSHEPMRGPESRDALVQGQVLLQSGEGVNEVALLSLRYVD